jgi:threonine dehydratase
MTFRHSLHQIREAKRILAAHLPSTSLKPAFSTSRAAAQVYLKMETELPTASFKPRGALAALSMNLHKCQITEVIAASTGNHGAAVAWAAAKLSVPATIFLPSNPNPVKRSNIASLGARIVEAGGQDLAHAFLLEREHCARPGSYFLNDATDPDLPTGPATIGLEILEQLAEVRCVYVPMGDTALIRGVSTAMKQVNPGIRIVGVQAERAPSYYLSWKSGAPVPTETCDTCADGLATRTPESENVHAICELVDDVVLVSEEELLNAMRSLFVSEGVLAEPAGAAATAAYLKQPTADGPVVLLVTGANVTDEIRLRAGLPATSAAHSQTHL